MLLDERVNERGDRRHVDRPQHHRVGVGRGDLAGDRRVVGRLHWKHLGVDGLDAGALENALRLRDLRLSEWIVDGRVGGGLRALARGQRGDPLRPGDEVELDWDRDVKDVVQPLCKDRWSATRTFDERVSVPSRHPSGRRREERRERTEDQRHLVGADQRLVVRDHLRRARGVGQHLQLDPVSQQPALGVLVVDPELIALLERLAVRGEVARERERGPDRDRASRGAAATAAAAAAATGAAARREHRDATDNESRRQASAKDLHRPLLDPGQATPVIEAKQRGSDESGC